MPLSLVSASNILTPPTFTCCLVTLPPSVDIVMPLITVEHILGECPNFRHHLYHFNPHPISLNSLLCDPPHFNLIILDIFHACIWARNFILHRFIVLIILTLISYRSSLIHDSPHLNLQFFKKDIGLYTCIWVYWARHFLFILCYCLFFLCAFISLTFFFHLFLNLFSVVSV